MGDRNPLVLEYLVYHQQSNAFKNNSRSQESSWISAALSPEEAVPAQVSLHRDRGGGTSSTDFAVKPLLL